MSKKTEALEVILGLMPNAKFIDKNGKDVAEENQRLKELLKECREVIEWYKGDCGYKDVPTESVLIKINEVLK